MSCFKNIVKNCLPHGLLLFLQEKRRAVRFQGDFSSWKDAAAHAEGYEAENILEKVKASVAEVLKGNAVFERDSVLFYQEDPNYPLITAVLRATAGKQELKVLDFGGGLGSAYFQNRKFFSHYTSVSWRIVEQKHFAEAGNGLFREYDIPISFYHTVDEAMADWRPDIVLFSSVLQYLEDYKTVIKTVKEKQIGYIMLDRCLCFQNDMPHRYCVQHIGKEICKSSYAVQIFNMQELLSAFVPEYIVQDEYFSYPEIVKLTSPASSACYRGVILKHHDSGKDH